MRPCSVTTPIDTASGDVQRADGAGFAQDHAPVLHSRRKGGHGQPGFGPRVRGGVERALPRGDGPFQHGGGFGGGQQARVNLMRAGMFGPVLKPLHLAVGLGQIQDAGLPEPKAIAKLGGELFPDGKAFHHDRQLARVPALLAHPAPVAARLFARDAALFAQGDGQTLLPQEPRRHHPDDAAPDDDHIRPRRKRGVEADRAAVVDRKGHAKRAQQAFHETVARLKFADLKEFVRLVRLGNVARAADDGGIPGLLKLPGLGAVADNAGRIRAGQAAGQHFGGAIGFGDKGRHAEEAVKDDPGLGAHLLHRGVKAGGFGLKRGLIGGDILTRDHAHFHGKAAVGGGDVMGGAALRSSRRAGW